jgi:hypothetical protein
LSSSEVLKCIICGILPNWGACASDPNNHWLDASISSLLLNWRNIPIALTDTVFGEEKAHACVIGLLTTVDFRFARHTTAIALNIFDV